MIRLMKLAISLNSSLIISILSTVLAFYAPVSTTLLVVFMVITVRFVLDMLIVRKSRKSRGTKCQLYLNAGRSFFMFLIAYLVIILLVYPIDINLLSFFGSKNFIVTRGAALMIIIYESIIINLRTKVLTSESIGERIIKVVKVVRNAKKIKD